MDVYVYADLLFLVNAGMDGLCMILTGRLLHTKTSSLRVLAAAVLGGIYAVISLFPDLPRGISLLLDVGVCFLMCALVFVGKRMGGWRRYFLSVLLYVLLSMALGGVMTALYSLWNRLGIEALLPQEQEGLGTWLFAILALLGGGITLWGGKLFRRRAAVRECEVTVLLDGRSVTLRGLVDTGNLLKDPLGGRAVICADARRVIPILSPDFAKVLEHPTGMSELGDCPDARRLRLIPAGTATGERLLTGIVPDLVLLRYTDGGKARERTADVVLAVTCDMTDTEALVPSELIE